MTSPVSAIEAIEKAIEHATPGPWQTRQMGKRLNKQIDRLFVVGPSEVVHGLDGICEPDRMNDRMFGEDNSNMLYIAACNPVAMREILALARQAEALQRENAELRAFAASFKLTCVESSFYKDCYLHISEPDSVSFRLGNGSQFSKFIAGLEDRRARALLGGSENAE